MLLLCRYSRKVMWLKVCSSNNNPRYIASYFFNCVREAGGAKHLSYIKLIIIIICVMSLGCPTIMRTDAGTENSILAVVQPMLRHYHSDDFSQERSFLYGRSTSNQV